MVFECAKEGKRFITYFPTKNPEELNPRDPHFKFIVLNCKNSKSVFG